MNLKRSAIFGFYIGTSLLVPLLSTLQDLPVSAQLMPNNTSANSERMPIRVFNNYKDTVVLTLWTPNKEKVGTWTLPNGKSAYLNNSEGRRLRVSSLAKIKVGEEWGWVDVGQVAEQRNNTWIVDVRTIWQKTHEGIMPNR